MAKSYHHSPLADKPTSGTHFREISTVPPRRATTKTHLLVLHVDSHHVLILEKSRSSGDFVTENQDGMHSTLTDDVFEIPALLSLFCKDLHEALAEVVAGNAIAETLFVSDGLVFDCFHGIC